MDLCRERLARIQRVLSKNVGALTVREFSRSFGVWEWELEQASILGWIQIDTHRPHTGRPSRIVQAVSNPEAAKLPPCRAEIERPISIRHWRFALFSAFGAIKGGQFMGGRAAMLHRCLFESLSQGQEAPGCCRQHEPPFASSERASRPGLELFQDRRRDPQGGSHAANRRRNLATSPRGWKLESARLNSLGDLMDTCGRSLDLHARLA